MDDDNSDYYFQVIYIYTCGRINQTQNEHTLCEDAYFWRLVLNFQPFWFIYVVVCYTFISTDPFEHMLIHLCIWYMWYFECNLYKSVIREVAEKNLSRLIDKPSWLFRFGLCTVKTTLKYLFSVEISAGDKVSFSW